jgi:hypothetical protein
MKVIQSSNRTLAKMMLLALLGLFLSLAPVNAAAPNNQPRNLYMVSVGETYTRGGQPQQALACCENDARDMAGWAASQKGKLFQDVQAVPMIDGQARAADIINTLRGFKDQVNQRDYVIVYMSGHGGCHNGVFSFCAYDRNVSWNEIQGALRDVRGTVIVILDACQSGGVRDCGNMIVLSAALADQNSLGGEHNSLYTKFLLEALNGRADMNQDGFISLAEVDAYVSGKLALAHRFDSTLARPANVPSTMPLAKLAPAVTTSSAGNGSANPVAPVVAHQIAGTSWTGRENLGGYSNLLFRFEAGGRVTMIDARSTVQGTYTQTGNQVSLQFPSVRASYQGTINGTALSGQGSNVSGETWAFSVSKN